MVNFSIINSIRKLMDINNNNILPSGNMDLLMSKIKKLETTIELLHKNNKDTDLLLYGYLVNDNAKIKEANESIKEALAVLFWLDINHKSFDEYLFNTIRTEYQKKHDDSYAISMELNKPLLSRADLISNLLETKQKELDLCNANLEEIMKLYKAINNHKFKETLELLGYYL